MLRLKSIGVLLMGLVLTGCQSFGQLPGNVANPAGDNTAGDNTVSVENAAARAAPNDDIKRVHSWLLSGKYQRASRWLNDELSRHIDNAELQFLNGLTYHLMSHDDISKRGMAAEGYKLSLKFDHTRWAPRYFLGLLALEAKQYDEALRNFSEAALYNGENPLLLSDLAATAYLQRQPDMAAGIYRQLVEKFPNNQQHRSGFALSLAALNLPEQAEAELAKITNPAQSVFTKRRIADWQRFYRTAELSQNDADGGVVKVQNYGYEGEDEGDSPAGPIAQARSNRQVTLDVVLIRSEETATQRRGVNLLNGLNILYDVTLSNGGGDSGGGFSGGGGDSPPSGTSFTEGQRFRVGNLGGQDGNTFTALQYSLNIANARGSRNEVLARPSITVVDGESSKFFSGRNILAAVSGSESSSPLEIDRDIGVSLNVQPLFLTDKQIQLKIDAERTFLTLNDIDSGGTGGASQQIQRIETSKTVVNTSVVMRLGETLILSGLSEKETLRVRDGTPFLQDVPLVQYLFSQKDTLDFQRSVMILVTPRDPAYTYKPFASNVRDDAQTVEELKAQYQDWFSPYPNSASVFYHLESNRLYREFRTGDVNLEAKVKFQSRLQEAINSFYF